MKKLLQISLISLVIGCTDSSDPQALLTFEEKLMSHLEKNGFIIEEGKNRVDVEFPRPINEEYSLTFPGSLEEQFSIINKFYDSQGLDFLDFSHPAPIGGRSADITSCWCCVLMASECGCCYYCWDTCESPPGNSGIICLNEEP